ncbi:Aldo/keto reductase [Dacryopinax primogenitus]|uniref:Aldo/keto reductase n=1 Tax=Dacryopinax primogenitus (strain DJM 731) TaxID=1858805 RepID=M5FQ74_DACPD|nr:Aldo/keto reductase [Dacryopinax primogenitus]EJT97558.1 Aldo/keto reductase [Dacryopinax primogenitus]
MADQKNLPQVEYRRLGKSGLRVSVPILGAMSFGSLKQMDWVIEEEEALPLLKYAWDRGVTTWDTANVYSAGVSEKIIAKAIKKYNIPRSKLVILTKCFGLVPDTLDIRANDNPDLKNTRDYVNQSGLSRGAIFNAVENSLARLETTYIDLLQIHRYDPNTPFEETMCALNDLVRSGKVRYIGASSMFAWQLAEYNHVAEKNGWTKFVSMQNHYSLMYREEEREVNKYCEYAGIGLIPWGPVAAGQLARPLSDQKDTARAVASAALRTLSAADEETIKRVEALANKKGWTMAQVALAWIDGKCTSPIVGFSSPQRLEEAIIPDKTLSPEDYKYLEEPYEVKTIRGHS